MALASKHKLSPNDTLGGYRLASRVAISQSCEIWEAQHGRSRRVCALKIMLPTLRGNRHQIAYLKHEYEVGRQLDHECIICTKDFGTAEGLAFIVMEYFPAPNIKQWLREDVPKALSLIPTIIHHAASGLGHMHRSGWIHRDVKPDNFLVDNDGAVKLIDFTLARKGGGWLRRLFNNRSKAQGTLSYMSPEQILNKPQDARSDIYSFGCVAYELVCGRPPFTGDNPKDLLNKHLRSAVPVMKARLGELDAEFVSIVNRMLAKEPNDRPASMEEVKRHLQASSVFLP